MATEREGMLPLIGLNARRGGIHRKRGGVVLEGKLRFSGGCLWLSAVSVRRMFALVRVSGILRI